MRKRKTMNNHEKLHVFNQLWFENRYKSSCRFETMAIMDIPVHHQNHRLLFWRLNSSFLGLHIIMMAFFVWLLVYSWYPPFFQKSWSFELLAKMHGFYLLDPILVEMRLMALSPFKIAIYTILEIAYPTTWSLTKISRSWILFIYPRPLRFLAL